jgi:hypothetical protein
MAFYRDQFARISLTLVRSLLKPAQFRKATFVRLEKFGFEVDVKLARVPSPTSYGGERVFFQCPRPSCGSFVNVLGCASGVGWGCTKCLRWRGRNRRRIVTSPPFTWPTAAGDHSTGKVDAP